MSEATPTRRRSTSCLTRMDLQNGQVVWTALDHLNVISAPQLGQFAFNRLRAQGPGLREGLMSAAPQARPTWIGGTRYSLLARNCASSAAQRRARRRSAHEDVRATAIPRAACSRTG